MTGMTLLRESYFLFVSKYRSVRDLTSSISVGSSCSSRSSRLMLLFAEFSCLG